MFRVPVNLDSSSSFGFCSFLQNGLLDTISLGQTDQRLSRGSSNDKDIGKTSGEGVALGILDGNNGEGTIVTFDVHESTHTSTVTSTGEHDSGAHFEFKDIAHLSGSNINLDSVVDLKFGVRVTKSASIVCDSHRDLVGSDVDLLDTTQLVLGFLPRDSVQNESSLGVVEKTETVVGLFHFEDIHESARKAMVSADLSVDLDATFHGDLHAFLAGKSVLETFFQDDSHGQAFSQFVWTGRWSGGPDSTHLTQVPLVRGVQTLQVFLRTTATPETIIQKGRRSERVLQGIQSATEVVRVLCW